MPANTLISDINELHLGLVLSNRDWSKMGPVAKNQYNRRLSEVSKEDAAMAIGRAEKMAEEVLKWCYANEYSGSIKEVWWTARPGTLSQAVGRQIDQKENPADILIRFAIGPADGFLGISAKSTQGKNDIGFKNPGVGTLDRILGLNMSKLVNIVLQKTIVDFQLPKSALQRKAYIRKNTGLKKQTEIIGSELLGNLRNMLFSKYDKINQKQFLDHLLHNWMDAEIIYPPYIKATGMGSKQPFIAVIMDPIKNEKLNALVNYAVTAVKLGNESIGIKAGDKRIMIIRFKFESEKMASSVKLSGDPWK